MTQDTFNLFLGCALLAYLGSIAVILALASYVARRARRLESAGQQLHDLAQRVVTRYTWAKDGTARDEWVIVDRTIADLDKVARKWQATVNDDSE